MPAVDNTGSRGTRLLAGDFDPMATNVIAMLNREFEWEHVAVQVQFVTGLLAYGFAQALRVYYVLHNNLTVARAAVCVILFSVAQMVGFFNSHMSTAIGNDFCLGLPQLIGRYCTLALDRAVPWIRTPGEPFRLAPFLAGVLFFATFGFALLALIDIDLDGSITSDDLTGWVQRLARGFSSSESRKAIK